MNQALPPSAFFLPPRTGENKGVDFLGLRQTNLDMMAELIPSTNNVTEHIRPFSLLCWIYWKFHQLCAEKNILEPNSNDLKSFRERIEILFTWGARVENYPGIPGKQAEPPLPDGEQCPLTFSAWGRVQSSTSLIAALWYGPAAKALTGLGFLLPGKGGFFRTVEAGNALAEALDELLRIDQKLYSNLLGTLDTVLASQEEAVALWALWSPSIKSDAEEKAFRQALFSESAIGDYATLIGKRSNTLALAHLQLAKSNVSLSAEAIRRGMFLSQASDGTAYEVPPDLYDAHQKWIILQMRQLQRHALETLLSWCEARIIAGRRDTDALSDELFQAWRDLDQPFAAAGSFADAIQLLDKSFGSLDDFIDQCRNGELPTPFSMMEAIAGTREQSDHETAGQCLYGVLLCAAFARCFPGETQELRQGGSSRISLFHLRKRLLGLGDMPLREALRFVIENMIISQHLATAVNRFDGSNQRLRLTIEETGLVPLVGSPWEPNVTEDRLPTLLSLAAGCGLLTKSADNLYGTSNMKG